MPQTKDNSASSNDKLVKKDLESSLASLTESKLIVGSNAMNR